MIGVCGITCTDCDAFIATQKNDDTKRREVAEAWSKAFDHEFKPEDINCDGCLTADGQHINHWSVCEIRKCGTEKEAENCAHCIDYKCEKIEKFHEQVPEAKKTLDEIKRKSSK
ncbi:MAG: DUF3795 domain-containing protein [Candidatus Bathyarchaeota archaeon]|nr:MAG: DUF3795 domain-containing protein [Candidatus Bathyarchaeota archaeon]UCE44565.1 MAG: DUF3795 domain-containing protein [Candidatus Bathyarchaeota archaeon]